MSRDGDAKGWRRWRDAAFATCTAWLVLQNLMLLALAAWGRPGSALAAGTAIATSALSLWSRLCMLALAVALGLALAAYLVHAPVTGNERDPREVRDGR